MGIVFRQSIKTSIVTFTGAALGAVTMYLGMKLIPEQEWGFRNNLNNQAVVGGQVFLLGLHNTLSVYIHKYNYQDKRRAALITMSFVLPFLVTTVAALLFFLLKPQILQLFQERDIPFVSKYYYLVPLNVLFLSGVYLFEQYLISELKVAKATFNREIVLRVLNLVLILSYVSGYIDFEGFIVGTVAVFLVPLGIAYWFSRQTGGFQLSLNWKVFNKEERKKLVDFSGYHSLINIQGNLMGFLDALMLPVLAPAGLAIVGVYMGAILIASFLQIPFRAMQNATFPILAQAFRDNDRAKIQDVFNRSSINILIASLGLFVLIGCQMDKITQTLPPIYEALTPLFFILSIGRLVDMATGMNDHVLSISNLYRYNFWFSLLLLVMLFVFNLLLIPIYGVYGAAWGSSAAAVVFNVMKFWIVRRKLQLQPFSVQTLKVVLAAGVSFVIGWFLPEMINFWVDIVLRSGIIMVVFVGMLIFLRPSADLNSYLASAVRSRRLF